MLYSLLDTLARETGWTPLITLLIRAGLAALTALAIALGGGRLFIAMMRGRRVFETAEKGDSLKLDELHRDKGKTPTMGGVIFLGAAALSLLLW